MKIDKKTFRLLLLDLGFEQESMFNRYRKAFPQAEAELVADFDTDTLVFPEAQGLKVNNRGTCNFAADENAVVFECVHRLLAQGYLPRHLELEPTWKLGRGSSGGRADILVKDNQGKAHLIIECKTAGKEFNDAWKIMQADGGQPLSYAQQEKSVQYVALYASRLDTDTKQIVTDLHLVRTHDNPPLLEQLRLAHPGQELPTFTGAGNFKEMYRAWAETYQMEAAARGLFDADTPPFQIGKKNYTLADLRAAGTTDTSADGKYNRFATILRKHNVAGRENAFDKLVNLFLCKIVDEQENQQDLKFRWKGRAYDSDFDLQDRLQQLYSAGMKAMLREQVTYITNAQIDDAFRFVRNDPDATRDTIKKYFRELKFFTNNDFAFIDVHNEKLFELNAVVLREIVELFQEMRLRTDEPNQFLGDLFEGFLDGGVKQSEGQFFTPIPVVRFLLYALPLPELLAQHAGPLAAIDYACGAGHFLNELAVELRRLLPTAQPEADPDRAKVAQAQADAGLVGIEKEYRLSKVAKVSAFMYGQQHTEIIHGDGLTRHAKAADGSFRLLIANPPYSVKGFLETLPEAERLRYKLYESLDKKTRASNNSIETFFIERAAQLLAPGGLAAIVLPSSVLTNGGIYQTTRELLLQHFELVAVVQLGSRTFGKTGTNTVTLFLRRRPENPAPADHYLNRVNAWFRSAAEADGGQAVYQDEDLLRRYCQHQGWDLGHYRTLLHGQPNEELLAHELLQDYRRAFEGQTRIKKLRAQLKATPQAETEAKKPRKAKDNAGLAAELDREWVDYLQRQERDKLYYYVLAAADPIPGTPARPVVLIKGPADTAEQKTFLGYEWSGAKGNEGIKYLTSAAAEEAAPAPKPKKADEDTADAPDPDEVPEALATQSKLAHLNSLLYDPEDLHNPAKLNTYIARAFRGEAITVPEELAPYLSTARLVDMLDFGRVSFEKQFSISPTRRVIIETVWPLERLEQYVEVIGGLWTGKNPPFQTVGVIRNTNFVKDGRLDFSDVAQLQVEQSQFKNRQLRPGDLIVEKSGGSETQAVGRVVLFTVAGGEYSFSNFTARLRVVDKTILPAYLHIFLNFFYAEGYTLGLQNGASGLKNLDVGRYLANKIPVPPAEVQAALVAACEAVDQEAAAATAALATARQQVVQAVQDVYSAGHATSSLGKLAREVQYGLNEAMNTFGRGYRIFRMNEIIERRMADNGRMKYADISPEEFAKYRLNKGDLLFNRTNSIEHVDKTGIFDLEGDYCFASYLIRVVVDAERVDARFVNLMMNSRAFQEEAKSKAARAINQANINATVMQGISIPVPTTLAEQQQLVATVAGHEAAIAAAQAIMQEAPARKQALVRQYLQGPAPTV